MCIRDSNGIIAFSQSIPIHTIVMPTSACVRCLFLRVQKYAAGNANKVGALINHLRSVGERTLRSNFDKNRLPGIKAENWVEECNWLRERLLLPFHSRGQSGQSVTLRMSCVVEHRQTACTNGFLRQNCRAIEQKAIAKRNIFIV